MSRIQTWAHSSGSIPISKTPSPILDYARSSSGPLLIHAHNYSEGCTHSHVPHRTPGRLRHELVLEERVVFDGAFQNSQEILLGDRFHQIVSYAHLHQGNSKVAIRIPR